MIRLKTLTWSNMFSYGEAENSIDFSNNKLTQLIGKNGDGKSSIALILEEVLFNKNSKCIKKADIKNRYTLGKTCYVSLTFDKDEDEYCIKSVRGTTLSVTLLKNGEDISGNTSTSTYKTLADIIGMDHKAFSQIIYQSHSSSLEFLKSPDTARKRFLIDLLGLNKYTTIGEYFKKALQDLNKDVVQAETKVATIRDWIASYNQTDLVIKDYEPDVIIDPAIDLEISKVADSLNTLAQRNKDILQNLLCKSILDSTIIESDIQPPVITDTSELVARKAVYKKSLEDAKQLLAKMRGLGHVCPTCTQEIDQERVSSLTAEQEEIIEENSFQVYGCTKAISEANDALKAWAEHTRLQEEWEKYYRLYDPNMPSEALDEKDLQARLAVLRDQAELLRTEAAEITKRNKAATEHNTKVELIISQLVSMEKDLNKWVDILAETTKSATTLSTLVKTFSTTGLVAYKIETLVTDLEAISNEYLGELSSGRFQIGFVIAGNDKLNVVITDNGKDIEMQALSAGETARVNVAVLLAIRKLTSSLFSDARVNLLFLDETISTLDTDGKEKLIEVLLAEDDLNTILVSHEYTHPLLEKVTVVKDKNISNLIKD